MAISVGEIVDGKVTGITKYAAFVALCEGKSGMVHISEVSHNYVNDIKDHLQEGQDVTVKIISIDEMGRINLSIKKTAPPPMNNRDSRPARGGGNVPRRPVSNEPLTFEDKLKQFMHESENRMTDLKSAGERRVSRRKGRG